MPDNRLTPTTAFSRALVLFADHKPERLAEKSWAYYLSSLRALAKQIPGDPVVGWLPPEAVDDAFGKMAAIYKNARYAQARAAWKILRTWALQQGVTLPPGPERRRRGPPPVVFVPSPGVGAALLALMRAIPDRAFTHRVLLDLQWAEFRTENVQGRKTLLIPSNGSFVIVPPEAMEHVRVLWDYARGLAERPLGPFLPATPGADSPMSLDTLRKLLSGAKARAAQEPKAPRPAAGSLEGIAAVIRPRNDTAKDPGDAVP